MRVYKCCYCHENIDQAELHKQIKIDKYGNTILLKSGQPQYKNSHIKCFNENDKNKIMWVELTCYIEKKYFNVVIPAYLCIKLRELGQKVNYLDIYGCLKSIEDDLLKYIESKTFKNDTQKSNYILSALKNNLNSFIAAEKTKDLNIAVEQKELENTVQLIDRSKIKPDLVYNNNFDFLD